MLAHALLFVPLRRTQRSLDVRLFCSGQEAALIWSGASRKQDEIGWRKEAYHLLVFATDDVPHLALDGRLAGLVTPHDGRCHLDEHSEYNASTIMVVGTYAVWGGSLGNICPNIQPVCRNTEAKLYLNVFVMWLLLKVQLLQVIFPKSFLAVVSGSKRNEIINQAKTTLLCA